MKLLFTLCSVIALCAAEAPLSGPYPASGWKPRGTQFLLPGQFLPQTNRAQDQNTNVEINKEQVNFAGQTTETEQTAAEPNQAYLPPAESEYADETIDENTDGLRVSGLPQGLPSDEGTAQFAEPQSENQQTQQYRFQNNQQFGRIQQQRQPQRNLNFNRQQQFGRLVQGSNSQRNQQRQNFQFARQQLAAPSQEYGAPRASEAEENEEVEANSPITNEEEEPSPSIANNLQKGRYYVLTPDNTLQRVNFQTFQDEEETRTNGFTAQLKYMPVEPIRDPIYAYNEQGVLVRIYRK